MRTGPVLLGLLLLAALLLCVLVANTLLVSDPAYDEIRSAEVSAQDPAAPRRLAAAIRFRTVSAADPGMQDTRPFVAFHAFLQQAFPGVHEHLGRVETGGPSLLYEWPGTNPDAQPVLFLAHQDVVPAADAEAWTHPPFSGTIADGFIWGRGAMDDKSSLMGWLEAAEQLLASGFRPQRTIYLAFGHDEETGGAGAAAIARHLASNNVRLEFVLDEGGFVGHGLLPAIQAPVALVGIAEKGYLTVDLTAEGEGGHSSRPPARTVIGIVSRAVAKLEDNPFPGRLDGATEAMFDRLAPYLPFCQRFVIANRWLLEPVLLAALERQPSMAPLVRTTIAPTMFRAGDKDNVLARRARATVNLRILPGESVDGTLERIRRVIDDPRVQVQAISAIEPSPTSSTASPAYKLLRRSIREVLGNDVIVSPYLMVAATDSRHFAPIADDVYRFFAMSVTEDDVARFHGVDERISVEDYETVVAVYYRLLQNLDGLDAR